MSADKADGSTSHTGPGQGLSPRLGLLALGIGLLAALSLAYELVLIRILGWVHHPQFAGMILSLALLGYALSGTVLALRRRGWPRHGWSVGLALAFCIAVPLCTGLAMAIPFNGLELVWDWRQLFYLAGVFLLLSLPFFLAATAIGLVLIRNPKHLGRLYGADLAGAGLGAVLALGLMNQLELPVAVLAISGLAAVSIPPLFGRLRDIRGWALAALAGVFALTLFWLDYPRIIPSQFKAMSQMLAAKGARKEMELHGPLGVLTVIANDQIPIRIAPGLSVLAGTTPPPQSALFVDAAHMAGLDAPNSDAGYLQAMTSALAYGLLEGPSRVLILEAGGGQPVRQALAGGAERVDVAVIDRRLERLYRARTGWAEGSAVHLHLSDPRHFLETTTREWRLIAWDSALAPGRPGALGLENYLLTVEGIESALGRLEDDGILSLTVPLQVPPRAAAKLLTTAEAALSRRGVSRPLEHVLIVRSWNTATALIGARAFERADAGKVERFLRRWGFDLVWAPGVTSDKVNQRMKWDQPWLFEVARGVQATDEALLDSYPFQIHPATDDRPYFDNYFKWDVVRTLLEQRREGGLVLLEMGYLLVLATLVQAIFFGGLLLVIPFLAGGRGWNGAGLGQWSIYFAAVGLGFMGIEIAFIQKLHLLFANPVHSIGVALSGFLLFAGLGGLLAARPGLMRLAAAGIAAICVVYALALDPIVLSAVSWPPAGRLLIALTLTAPLAFLMGVPFPTGLALLADQSPRSAGWAWGVNGCASVIAAPLAVLMAMELGFRWILLMSGLLYLVAAAVFRRQFR